MPHPVPGKFSAGVLAITHWLLTKVAGCDPHYPTQTRLPPTRFHHYYDPVPNFIIIAHPTAYRPLRNMGARLLATLPSMEFPIGKPLQPDNRSPCHHHNRHHYTHSQVESNPPVEPVPRVNLPLPPQTFTTTGTQTETQTQAGDEVKFRPPPLSQLLASLPNGTDDNVVHGVANTTMGVVLPPVATAESGGKRCGWCFTLDTPQWRLGQTTGSTGTF